MHFGYTQQKIKEGGGERKEKKNIINCGFSVTAGTFYT